eukprot:GHVH01004507.1.p1 GENE.GHVH01004507.1~~GHVH01004507.1.p1  ORF type:complete len:3828 (+),score=509.29 GHVH01004507.1:109-11592(+)
MFLLLFIQPSHADRRLQREDDRDSRRAINKYRVNKWKDNATPWFETPNADGMLCIDDPMVMENNLTCKQLSIALIGGCEQPLADLLGRFGQNLNLSMEDRSAITSYTSGKQVFELCPWTCGMCSETCPTPAGSLPCLRWHIGNGLCEDQCNTSECQWDALDCQQVDCRLSSWSDWSECSVPCDDFGIGGYQTRTRSIRELPRRNGRECGDLIERKNGCNSSPCPISCEVSGWSEWTTCPQECGVHEQVSTREILVTPEPAGEPCPVLSFTRKCVGIDAGGSSQCPVDCVLSEWSSWSTCEDRCRVDDSDLPAQIIRTRQILRNPSGIGSPCGDLVEIEECDSTLCEEGDLLKLDGYTKLIDVCNRDNLLTWGEPEMCPCLLPGQVAETRTRVRGLRSIEPLSVEEVDNILETYGRLGVPPPGAGRWLDRFTGGGAVTESVRLQSLRWLCVELNLMDMDSFLLEVPCPSVACVADCVYGEWTPDPQIMCKPINGECGYGLLTTRRPIVQGSVAEGCKGTLEMQIPCIHSQCSRDCSVSEYKSYRSDSQCTLFNDGENIADCGRGFYFAYNDVVPELIRGRGCTSSERFTYGACEVPCQNHLENQRRYNEACQMSSERWTGDCSRLCEMSRETDIQDGDPDGIYRRRIGNLNELSYFTPSIGSCPMSLPARDSQFVDCSVALAQCPPLTGDDCIYSEWGEWSECSQFCDGGQQTRRRRPLVFPRSRACVDVVETRFCNQGPCSTDCEYEPSIVKDCEAFDVCGEGQIVFQIDVKKESVGNGHPCPATVMRLFTLPCEVPCASVEEKPCVLETLPGPWGPCSADCNPNAHAFHPDVRGQSHAGVRVRVRSVANINSEVIDVSSCGSISEVEMCNENVPCDDSSCALSDEFVLGASCSSECSSQGEGLLQSYRTTLRNVDNFILDPGNDFGGLRNPKCNPEDISLINVFGTCITGDSFLTECPTDCVLDPNWGPWSECDAPCGKGSMTRTRGVLVPPSDTGRPCYEREESIACYSGPCVEDCQLGEWSDWSPCDMKCNGGQRFRTREILSLPSSGGIPCGDLVEIAPCNTRPCNDPTTFDCEVSAWSPWSECPKACGGAVQRRTRAIVKEGTDQGKPCPKVEDEKGCAYALCEDDPCEDLDDLFPASLGDCAQTYSLLKGGYRPDEGDFPDRGPSMICGYRLTDILGKFGQSDMMPKDYPPNVRFMDACPRFCRACDTPVAGCQYREIGNNNCEDACNVKSLGNDGGDCVKAVCNFPLIPSDIGLILDDRQIRQGTHPITDELEVLQLPVGSSTHLSCATGKVFKRFPAMIRLMMNCFDANTGTLISAVTPQGSKLGLNWADSSGYYIPTPEDSEVDDVFISGSDTLLGLYAYGAPSIPLKDLIPSPERLDSDIERSDGCLSRPVCRIRESAGGEYFWPSLQMDPKWSEAVPQASLMELEDSTVRYSSWASNPIVWDLLSLRQAHGMSSTNHEDIVATAADSSDTMKRLSYPEDYYALMYRHLACVEDECSHMIIDVVGDERMPWEGLYQAVDPQSVPFRDVPFPLRVYKQKESEHFLTGGYKKGTGLEGRGQGFYYTVYDAVGKLIAFKYTLCNIRDAPNVASNLTATDCYQLSLGMPWIEVASSGEYLDNEAFRCVDLEKAILWSRANAPPAEGDAPPGMTKVPVGVDDEDKPILGFKKCEDFELSQFIPGSAFKCSTLTSLCDSSVPADQAPSWLPEGTTIGQLCPMTCGQCEEFCGEGCPEWFIGNGFCDSSCNTSDCGFDDGDCEDHQGKRFDEITGMPLVCINSERFEAELQLRGFSCDAVIGAFPCTSLLSSLPGVSPDLLVGIPPDAQIKHACPMSCDACQELGLPSASTAKSSTESSARGSCTDHQMVEQTFEMDCRSLYEWFEGSQFGGKRYDGCLMNTLSYPWWLSQTRNSDLQFFYHWQTKLAPLSLSVLCPKTCKTCSSQTNEQSDNLIVHDVDIEYCNLLSPSECDASVYPDTVIDSSIIALLDESDGGNYVPPSLRSEASTRLVTKTLTPNQVLCPITCGLVKEAETEIETSKAVGDCRDNESISELGVDCAALIKMGPLGCRTPMPFYSDLDESASFLSSLTTSVLADFCGLTCRRCGWAATCNDGYYNGDEDGVDCGGGCQECHSCSLSQIRKYLSYESRFIDLNIEQTDLVMSGFGHDGPRVEHGSVFKIQCMNGSVKPVYCESGMWKPNGGLESACPLPVRQTISTRVAVDKNDLESLVDRSKGSETLITDAHVISDGLTKFLNANSVHFDEVAVAAIGACSAIDDSFSYMQSSYQGGSEEFICRDDPAMNAIVPCSLVSAFCMENIHQLAKKNGNEVPSSVPVQASIFDACPVTCNMCEQAERNWIFDRSVSDLQGSRNAVVSTENHVCADIVILDSVVDLPARMTSLRDFFNSSSYQNIEVNKLYENEGLPGAKPLFIASKLINNPTVQDYFHQSTIREIEIPSTLWLRDGGLFRDDIYVPDAPYPEFDMKDDRSLVDEPVDLSSLAAMVGVKVNELKTPVHYLIKNAHSVIDPGSSPGHIGQLIRGMGGPHPPGGIAFDPLWDSALGGPMPTVGNPYRYTDTTEFSPTIPQFISQLNESDLIACQSPMALLTDLFTPGGVCRELLKSGESDQFCSLVSDGNNCLMNFIKSMTINIQTSSCVLVPSILTIVLRLCSSHNRSIFSPLVSVLGGVGFEFIANELNLSDLQRQESYLSAEQIFASEIKETAIPPSGSPFQLMADLGLGDELLMRMIEKDRLNRNIPCFNMITKPLPKINDILGWRTESANDACKRNSCLRHSMGYKQDLLDLKLAHAILTNIQRARREEVKQERRRLQVSSYRQVSNSVLPEMVQFLMGADSHEILNLMCTRPTQNPNDESLCLVEMNLLLKDSPISNASLLRGACTRNCFRPLTAKAGIMLYNYGSQQHDPVFTGLGVLFQNFAWSYCRSSGTENNGICGEELYTKAMAGDIVAKDDRIFMAPHLKKIYDGVGTSSQNEYFKLAPAYQADGCPTSTCPKHFIGDGICDVACFRKECQYDLGDCTSPVMYPAFISYLSLSMVSNMNPTKYACDLSHPAFDEASCSTDCQEIIDSVYHEVPWKCCGAHTVDLLLELIEMDTHHPLAIESMLHNISLRRTELHERRCPVVRYAAQESVCYPLSVTDDNLRRLESGDESVFHVTVIRLFVRVTDLDEESIEISREVLIESLQRVFIIRQVDILSVTLGSVNDVGIDSLNVMTVTFRVPGRHPHAIPLLPKSHSTYVNHPSLDEPCRLFDETLRSLQTRFANRHSGHHDTKPVLLSPVIDVVSGKMATRMFDVTADLSKAEIFEEMNLLFDPMSEYFVAPSDLSARGGIGHHLDRDLQQVDSTSPLIMLPCPSTITPHQQTVNRVFYVEEVEEAVLLSQDDVAKGATQFTCSGGKEMGNYSCSPSVFPSELRGQWTSSESCYLPKCSGASAIGNMIHYFSQRTSSLELPKELMMSNDICGPECEVAKKKFGDAGKMIMDIEAIAKSAISSNIGLRVSIKSLSHPKMALPEFLFPRLPPVSPAKPFLDSFVDLDFPLDTILNLSCDKGLSSRYGGQKSSIRCTPEGWTKSSLMCMKSCPPFRLEDVVTDEMVKALNKRYKDQNNTDIYQGYEPVLAPQSGVVLHGTSVLVKCVDITLRDSIALSSCHDGEWTSIGLICMAPTSAAIEDSKSLFQIFLSLFKGRALVSMFIIVGVLLLVVLGIMLAWKCHYRDLILERNRLQGKRFERYSRVKHKRHKKMHNKKSKSKSVYRPDSVDEQTVNVVDPSLGVDPSEPDVFKRFWEEQLKLPNSNSQNPSRSGSGFEPTKEE